jgi:hypothetical protein
VVTVRSARLIAERARCARTPSTYSCRVSNPVPTLAFQMFFAESASVQPVARCAPVMTGRAPSAAFQITE